MKTRLYEADFIRAISAFGILVYHFSCTIDEYNSGTFFHCTSLQMAHGDLYS